MTGRTNFLPSRGLVHASAATLTDEWHQIVEEERTRKVSLRGPIVAGLATLGVGVGGFFLWAYFTPVAQASAAAGKVVVESSTKTVTHLEGGTLREVLVSEGEAVRTGQVLARLDVTRSFSVEVQARQQLFINQVKLARLLAERDENHTFTVPEETPKGMSAAMAAQLLKTEQRLFQERQSQYADQIASAQSEIDQIEILFVSFNAKQKALEEQLTYLKQDYELLSSLESKRLATKPQKNEKRIQILDMESRIAEAHASLGQNRQLLAQAKLNLANIRTEHLRSISEQLQQVQTDIARGQQEIVGAADVVEMAAIRSPQDGVVSNIKIHTPGSALSAGTPIMDIVPADQPLLIEGKARAMDIDTIRVGASAEIHLSSFGADEAFPLKGKVIYVAADSVADEKTGDTTYLIRVKIDKGELASQPNLFMYPGMGAEIYVVNGERTALTYLTSPLLKSFSRAFREQ